MTRRDLMKFFGVGATTAPVVAGELIQGAQAKLIEVPRVELVKTMIPIVVNLREPHISLLDVTSHSDNFMVYQRVSVDSSTVRLGDKTYSAKLLAVTDTVPIGGRKTMTVTIELI